MRKLAARKTIVMVKNVDGLEEWEISLVERETSLVDINGGGR